MTRYGGTADANAFFDNWAVMFEGFQRRAAFNRYPDLTNLFVPVWNTRAASMGSQENPANDVKINTDLQDKVEPFFDVVEAFERRDESSFCA